MNLPTKITFSRIVATVILIVTLFVLSIIPNIQTPLLGNSRINLIFLVLFVFFVIASYTDHLDGKLARKNNQVTDLGKMLDAIADKVLVNPILIVLACNGFIPVIIPVIYVTRDIIVDAIKMQAANGGKVQAAIKSGKYKTAFMMIGISFVFFYNIPFEFINIRVDLGFLYLACILSIISMIEYYNINKHLISANSES